jgi:hypothetical protein
MPGRSGCPGSRYKPGTSLPGLFFAFLLLPHGALQCDLLSCNCSVTSTISYNCLPEELEGMFSLELGDEVSNKTRSYCKNNT